MPFLRERSGRWSTVKVVAFFASLGPGLWLAYQAMAGELGPRPLTEAIHQSGDWALRLLLVTLAVTPAQRILRYPRLVAARRILGVASGSYAALHFCLYVLDQQLDLFKVASEIAFRIYLLIGVVTLVGLITLAATSTDKAIRRLGSQRWTALHCLVYGLAPLAVVHFFMQSKLETYQPILMAGFLMWLMAYRALYRFNGEVTPVHLLLLAAAIAGVTAVGESLLYMFTSGVDAWRVLLAHFDLDMDIRPAAWVLASGLVVAVPALFRYGPRRVRSRADRIVSRALSGATQAQSGS